MFVLGTAGHIDHGKSSLIKAMTGIDPDRLPEEKQRGMTIDLGFAWMKLPGGDEIGLVDVPGHEKFVRNMVAGAGGINAAMLVIAADDGWMPQTQEHLDILNLLDLKYGFVALTKTDLVDADWIELVKADIEEKLTGTFLEGAPIVPCSSETKDGVPDVVAAIEAISRKIKNAEDIGKARLFIDRSFILTGIGVVVTGTSRGGGFSADSDAFHFPSQRKIRIRSLQSHERQVNAVGAGTRVAINITGADRDKVSRGDVITGFLYDRNPVYFAVTVENLANSVISLKEGRKVLIIHGTTETEAIVRPFSEKGIKPGETGLAILKTAQPLAAFVMDNFILRLPTPQVTIGGGTILDVLDIYPRRKALADFAEYLNERISGNIDSLIMTEIRKQLFSDRKQILAYSNFSDNTIDAAIAGLIDSEKIVEFDGKIGNAATIAEYTTAIVKALEKTHRNKSYLKGLTAEELMKRIKLTGNDEAIFLFKYLEHIGTIDRTRQYYHAPGFSPSLDEAMKTEAEQILSAITQAGHSYLTFDDIERKFPGSRKTISFLRDNGQIKTVGTLFVMTAESWKEIMDFLNKGFTTTGKITLAELRDAFKTTRKYALPLLEYLDQIKITRRDGDFRVKGVDFDERHSL